MKNAPARLPNPVLAPSILAGNHARLAESMQTIIDAGCRWIHLDIMDGHFVPNLTFGPETLRSLREEAGDQLFFDVHLMLDNPQEYIEAFAENGADLISVHVEPPGIPVPETLRKIRDLGCQCGLVINPPTPAAALEAYLPDIDLALIMTVQPGFGGQTFHEGCLQKIAQVDHWRREKSLGFRLEVDGGVDERTGPLCRQAGADTLVAGTAFFKHSDQSAFRERLTANFE